MPLSTTVWVLALAIVIITVVCECVGVLIVLSWCSILSWQMAAIHNAMQTQYSFYVLCACFRAHFVLTAMKRIFLLQFLNTAPQCPALVKWWEKRNIVEFSEWNWNGNLLVFLCLPVCLLSSLFDLLFTWFTFRRKKCVWKMSELKQCYCVVFSFWSFAFLYSKKEMEMMLMLMRIRTNGEIDNDTDCESRAYLCVCVFVRYAGDKIATVWKQFILKWARGTGLKTQRERESMTEKGKICQSKEGKIIMKRKTHSNNQKHARTENLWSEKSTNCYCAHTVQQYQE